MKFLSFGILIAISDTNNNGGFMKFNFLVLVLLTTLASCSSKKSSSTEDCTSNGEKVSCDMFRAKEESAKKESVTLEVFVKGEYEVKNGTFKALTPMVKEDSKAMNGEFYTCSLNMPKGTVLGIEADERELRFINEGQILSFERSSQNNIDYTNLILGEFVNYDRVENTKTVMRFISNRQMEMKLVCKFN